VTTEANLQGKARNVTQQYTKEETEIFQWTKQWYLVAVVDFLDPTHPHAIQLLGKELVLWRDGSSQWRCFEDFCPHRLAPY
jgi:phenylpropionate dioxygenase-like ring-hydroxylating dioxygenase large terminal subunit